MLTVAYIFKLTLRTQIRQAEQLPRMTARRSLLLFNLFLIHLRIHGYPGPVDMERFACAPSCERVG